MIDDEKLFQKLKDRDWDTLAEILFQNRGLIKRDPMIRQVAHFFETELISHLDSLPAAEKLRKLRHISLIIESDRNSFTDEFVNQVIDQKLDALLITEDPSLAGFASRFIDRPLSKELLHRMRKQQPERWAEARRPETRIKPASERTTTAHTVKLFKSQQEKHFFDALSETFPKYLTYPNVAMSCAIDVSALKNNISSDELDYFFKAVIDFVLYDPAAGHEPLHFFELDSIYHDADKARRNDSKKDRIFQVAGIKLIRIRRRDGTQSSVDYFRKLLGDLQIN